MNPPENHESLPIEFDAKSFQITIHEQEDLILCGIAESADGRFDGTNAAPRVINLPHTFEEGQSKRIIDGLAKICNQKIDEHSGLDEETIRKLTALAKLNLIEALIDPA